MKAILHFTLPEDHSEFHAAIHGQEAISALWDIDNRCRSILKHGEPSEEVAAIVEDIRRMIPYECLQG